MISKLIHKTKNEINFNGYSYLARLAADGNNKIVDKKIGESPAAAYQAIYGYGTAGNIKAIQKLMSECQDKNKATRMAVRGLVRGQHQKELHKIKDYKNYKADIVFGHAQAANEDMVAIMVNRDPLLFEAAVCGYASVGSKTALLNLVKGTQFYGVAIYHAAKAGHVDLVNQLLATVSFFSADFTKVNDKEKIRSLGFVNKALAGYCNGYHLEAAGELLTKGGNIQTALDALKIDGKPSLNAYIGLFIAIPDEKSQVLLDQIQTELSLEDASISSTQVETIKKLRAEYSQSSLTLVSFLSELSSEGLNVLEELNNYPSP